MYDYTFCSDLREMRYFIDKANKNGYVIISVTEKHGYTIIYKK